MKKQPNLYIVAGANGSGKTTFANSLLSNYVSCANFVNADLIAKGISPFNPERAAIKAGKILLEEINDLAKKKADFAIESTLSGKTHVRMIKFLRKYSYQIHIFYLWVPSVELSIERISDRVKNGGHHVPTKDVRRRFKKSLDNFLHIYRNICDSWILFDNSTDKPRIVAQSINEEQIVMDHDLYNKIGG